MRKSRNSGAGRGLRPRRDRPGAPERVAQRPPRRELGVVEERVEHRHDEEGEQRRGGEAPDQGQAEARVAEPDARGPAQGDGDHAADRGERRADPDHHRLDGRPLPRPLPLPAADGSQG